MSLLSYTWCVFRRPDRISFTAGKFPYKIFITDGGYITVPITGFGTRACGRLEPTELDSRVEQLFPAAHTLARTYVISFTAGKFSRLSFIKDVAHTRALGLVGRKEKTFLNKHFVFKQTE